MKSATLIVCFQLRYAFLNYNLFLAYCCLVQCRVHGHAKNKKKESPKTCHVSGGPQPPVFALQNCKECPEVEPSAVTSQALKYLR